MLRKKHVVSVILAAVLAFSMCGCGDKTAVKPGEDNTVKWYFFSSPSSVNEKEIYSAAAEIAKKKTGVDLELLPVESGNYESKMQIITASLEKFDIMFVSNWLNNYYQNVSKGMLVDLDPYLNGDYSDLRDMFEDYWWEASKINGKIYAIPNQQIVAREPCFSVPKQNIKLLGINTEDYLHTASDYKGYLALVEKYMRLVKEKTGEYCKLGNIWWDGGNMFGIEEIAGSQLPGAIRFDSSEKTKLVNQYDTDEFRYYIKLRRKWVEEGLVQPDNAKVTLKNTDNPNIVLPAIERVNTYMPGVERTVSIQEDCEHEILIRTKPYVSSSGIIATMNGISATSEHPDLAMKILNLVNTDSEFINTLAYGIEGKNYKKVGNNTITINSDMPYTSTIWNVGNTFNGYLLEGQPENTYEETKQINHTAEKSVLIGFSPDLSKLKTEVAGCNSAVSEFLQELDYGMVDVDARYAQFMSKLETAGASKIIAEVQSQIDAWLAARK